VAQLTLIADAGAAWPTRLPDGLTVRAPRIADTGPLGQLYFDCRVPGADLAALLAVHRAPWDDTPDCPFIADLFVEPGALLMSVAAVTIR
jgi:hypothetical protein